MSQQIQITGGAKVRDLNDVIIGTNGVLSSLAFNVANGVPKLDSNGKILVSQLPNSVMEYLGTWNAATNTPTLANGVGNQGDVYLCNVAGTVNFGAGPITFAVGDTAIYSGSIWQKAGGATGTVTSVGLSTSGNAFTIGSSPVTTSGTITINGAGTASQYINGAGNLTTFPTLISSIGLSMPSAFSVSNSPLTANGTISVTGAGTVSQYIDGTGALQSFPSLTGYVPYVGATTDVDLGVHVLNAQALHVKGTAGQGHLGLKHQTATPTGSANESLVFANVDGDLGWQNGNLYSTILNTHSNTANRVYTFPDSSGTIALTSDLSNYVTLGTNQTISGSKTFSVQTNFNAAIYVQNAQPLYLLNSGNTYQIGLFASLGLSGNRTIYFPNADGTLALTSQLTSGTVTSVAALTLGTSGTDLNSTVANSTTTPVITLNVPDASATARGVITTGTQTIAGGKTFSGFASFQSSSGTNTQYGIYLGKGSTPTAFSSSNVNIYSDVTTNNLVIRDNLSTANLVFNNSTQTYTFPASTGTIALTSDLGSYVPTTRTISTTAPLQGGGDLSANRTLSITQATTSTNGYLSSTDWNTFNGKQNALTNPVTGTGTSGQVTYFNGTTSVTGSSNHFWDATNNRLGINTSSPSAAITSYSTSQSNQFKAAGTSPGITFSDAVSSVTYGGAVGVATAANNFITGAAAGDMAITNQSFTAGPILFGIGTTEKMRLTASGSLGIGNSSPSYTLDVTGTSRFKATGNAYSNGSIILTNSSGATSTYMTNSGGIFYLSNNGTTDHLQISSSGAATFSSTLSCSGAFIQLNQTEIFPSAGASNRAFAFQLSQVVAGDFSISSGSTATGGTYTPRFYINPSGNVSIGTTSNNSNKLQIGSMVIPYAGNEFAIGNGTIDFAIDLTATSTDIYSSAAMSFATSTTERMRINSTGEVGIGRASNNGKLEVQGVSQTSGNYSFIVYDSATNTLLAVRNDGAFYTGQGANSPMNATTANGANVYIDNTDKGRLYRSTSSIKYKKDVIDYTRGLNEVMQLRPVFYKGISDNDGDKQFAGLIAEEVDELGLTEFVQYRTDGTPDALAYQNMVALAFKAIQELSQQNQDLKSRLDKAGL